MSQTITNAEFLDTLLKEKVVDNTGMAFAASFDNFLVREHLVNGDTDTVVASSIDVAKIH